MRKWTRENAQAAACKSKLEMRGKKKATSNGKQKDQEGKKKQEVKEEADAGRKQAARARKMKKEASCKGKKPVASCDAALKKLTTKPAVTGQLSCYEMEIPR